MSPEMQRIKIAEACGWKRDDKCDCWRKDGEVAYCDGRDHQYRQLPDYLNDLNAMHEAQRTLDWAQTCLMYNWLDEICERPAKLSSGGIDMRIKRVWQANAPQRCEAFLRTLGLWMEDGGAS